MLEAVVHPLPTISVTIRDIPVPVPGPDELVIKVVVAGSNPKDWDHLTSQKRSLNSGDDIAGTVHGLGSAVEAAGEFHVGDRIAAFHRMGTAGGGYAEYAVAPANTAVIIPPHVSFEAFPAEAATIPLVTLTAALSLFRRQSLPPPWSPRAPSSPTTVPLLIYGASSALGAFAIKLARLSNIHPIIAIAGASSEHVKPLLDASRGDTLVDYRQGTEVMMRDVRIALNGLKPRHGLDAVSSKGSWLALAKLLGGGDHPQLNPPAQQPEGDGDRGASQLSVVSGANAYNDSCLPPAASVQIIYTFVGSAHDGAYKPRMPKQPSDADAAGDPAFARVFFRHLAKYLVEGEFRGHPFEVVEGGLRGVGEGLRRLKAGEAKGRKFVYRVEETGEVDLHAEY